MNVSKTGGCSARLHCLGEHDDEDEGSVQTPHLEEEEEYGR